MANRTARLFLTTRLKARLKPRLKPLLHMALLSGGSLLAGCTGLFFYPDNHNYIQPGELGLQHQDIQITSADGESLHGWWLPAQGTPLGTVYFLHGNAQNISAHLLNVAWLPKAGYNLFMLDYRGFGQSSGSPELEGALLDAEAGLHWAQTSQPAQINPSKALNQPEPLPLFLLGQSLGGALATLTATHRPEGSPRLNGVILDGTFAGFRQIAQEKLDSFWLTWPLQIPLTWTLPADQEPADHIAALAPTPLFIIHSHDDQIIPYHHGTQLYARAGQPRQFLATHTPHTATFMINDYQQRLLDFMTQHKTLR